MKLFLSYQSFYCLCYTTAFVLLRNIGTNTYKNRHTPLISNILFAGTKNSTFWTVPTTPIDLYSPSPILPLIPHDLARSIMLSRYSEALQSNIDVWIAQCEETRVYMNTRAVFSNVPTPRFTVIGDDYLIGFIAVNNGSLNVINICSVLPLHNSGNYNLTNVLTLFRIQYDPCIVLTDELSEYWRSVFHAYRLFTL